MERLATFAEANPIAPVTLPSALASEGVQKEDLKLICWLALA